MFSGLLLKRWQMNSENPKFLVRARAWAKEQGIHGPHVFLRYVMFIFVEALNGDPDREFVLKGGNLLWVLIRTPRSTIDLDLVTRQLKDHTIIKEKLIKICSKQRVDGLAFELVSLSQKDDLSSVATIAYTTPEGQGKTFTIDLVYALATEYSELPSPTNSGSFLLAATIENIIADKLAASHQFAGGNTRMKDYDDLWRIAQSQQVKIDWENLRQLCSTRQIPPRIDTNWLNSAVRKFWNSHIKRSPGLPDSLEEAFRDINLWLNRGLNS
jgi:hypothetical protein